MPSGTSKSCCRLPASPRSTRPATVPTECLLVTPGRDERSFPTWTLPRLPSPFRVLRHCYGCPHAFGTWTGPRTRYPPCRRIPLGSSPHQRVAPPLRSPGRVWSHLDLPVVCAGQSARMPFYRAPRPRPCARIPADAGLRGEPASAACPRCTQRKTGPHSGGHGGRERSGALRGSVEAVEHPRR